MSGEGKFKDLPRAQIMSLANHTIARLEAQGNSARVFFKYSCKHCGSRQAFGEPNVCYEQGTCSECGKVTRIKSYGFLLEIDMPGSAEEAGLEVLRDPLAVAKEEEDGSHAERIGTQLHHDGKARE